MLKLLNTLTGQKEEFEPINGKNVGIFVCGPTVYDWSHIGHARTYVIFDAIAKHLRYKGYKVKFIINITNIDDKIIKKAEEEKKSWEEVADFYEKKFKDDIKILGVDSVDKFAGATNHIKEIIKQVQILLDKDYAYQAEDGIYFNISKFADYGKLAKRTIKQAEDAVSRIDESVKKRNKGDFALWKFSHPNSAPSPKGYGNANAPIRIEESSWESPWGPGRPGWHIEDTAISEKYLGQQYDIHGGGLDLIFPHHEAEIAQQEAASGRKPFVKYWLHSGMLTVNGQKMSKSLGNFITIQDFLKKYPAEALRFMALSAHYRSPIDYKEDLIKQSEAAVQRFCELINKLKLLKKSGPKNESEIVEIDPVRGKTPLASAGHAQRAGRTSNGVDEIIKNTKLEFETKMDDDFNTPEALAVLFNFIRIVNAFIDDRSLDKGSAIQILKFLEEIDRIFGIIPQKESDIPEEIFELVQKREDLRKQKIWLKADQIREKIQNYGYLVEDTPYGPLVKLEIRS